MSEPLRPMGLGEILDRTFHIYRSRFLVFAGLAAIPPFVMAALVVANVLWWKIFPDMFGPKALLWYTPQDLFYVMVLGNVSTLLHIAIWPPVVDVAANTVSNKRSGIVDGLAACRKNWRRWTGVTFANWFGGLVLPEVLVSGVFIGTLYLMFETFNVDASDPPGIGPKSVGVWFVVVLVVFEWASACLSLSLPVWTLENGKVLAALRRGWRLSKRARWRIGFTRVAVACLAQILYVGLAMVLIFALTPLITRQSFWWTIHLTPRQFLQLARVVTSTVSAALVGPIFPIALTLFYYDQRMRREGYDIEKLMDVAGWSLGQSGPREEVAASQVQPEGAQG